MFQTFESRRMFASLGVNIPVHRLPKAGPLPWASVATLSTVREEATAVVPGLLSEVSHSQPQIKVASSDAPVCPLP